jgi:hypothetical protein
MSQVFAPPADARKVATLLLDREKALLEKAHLLDAKERVEVETELTEIRRLLEGLGLRRGASPDAMSTNDPTRTSGPLMPMPLREEGTQRVLDQWESIGARLAELPPSEERDEVQAKFDEISALLAGLGYRALT